MTHLLRRQCMIALISVAMLIPGMAHACQLVCMATTTMYTGNLGGWSGADAKCAAEFTGFKFARSISIVSALTGGYAAYTLTAGGTIWGGNIPGSLNRTCNNWTDGTGSYQGVTFTYNNGASPGAVAPPYITTTSCSTSYPLLCCNM